MTYDYDFALAGGDERQLYLSEFLINCGKTVCGCGLPLDNRKKRILPAMQGGKIKILTSFQDAVEASHYLIGPIPFSRDSTHLCSQCCSKDLPVQTLFTFLTPEQYVFGGIFSKEIRELFESNHFNYCDLMQSEDVAIRNAVATSEGAIFEAIQNSPSNLHLSSCLILGFGRCGQILAHKLKGLDCFVTIAARSPSVLASGESFGYETFPLSRLAKEVSQFDYIFNTIPAIVMPKEVLSHVKPETVIIDLASYPGGLDYSFVKYNELNAHLRLGLPGKISPKSSAKILCDEILQYINNNS